MFKQNKIKHSTKVSKSRSGKRFVKPDNLSLSTSYADNYTDCSRESSYALSTTSSAAPARNKSYEQSREFFTKPPRNVAVHFGNFYGLRSNAGKAHYDNRCDDRRRRENAAPIERVTRSIFTRQMVHKLERATGKADYARQVSALLKETVEPPNFRLNLPSSDLLSEDSIPNGGRGIANYPLWYKEPREIPLAFSNPIA